MSLRVKVVRTHWATSNYYTEVSKNPGQILNRVITLYYPRVRCMV